MKFLKSNIFSITAFGAGVAFGILMIYMPHGSHTFSIYTNLAIYFTTALATVGIISLSAGWLLRNTLTNPYLTSTFAILYLYVFSHLIEFTTLLIGALYIALLGLGSLALFQLSRLYFKKQQGIRTRKVVVAATLFVVLFIVSAVLGLMMTRVVASFIFT